MQFWTLFQTWNSRLHLHNFSLLFEHDTENQDDNFIRGFPACRKINGISLHRIINITCQPCRQMAGILVAEVGRAKTKPPKQINNICSHLDPVVRAGLLQRAFMTKFRWSVVACCDLVGELIQSRTDSWDSVVQADCCGLYSKNYCAPLWVDAAEPAYHNRLSLDHNPACTHLSPTQLHTETHREGGKGREYKSITCSTETNTLYPTL